MRYNKILKVCITAALVLTLALSLCSCGSKQKAEELMQGIREELVSSVSITATANIRADYGDRAFDFQVKFAGNGENDEIAILKPDNLAGIKARIGSGGAKIVYDGAELDTGPLAGGLSPAGIISMLLTEWKTGFTDFVSMEKLSSQKTLAMSTALPDGSTQKTWFDEKTGLPLRAEVSSKGYTVLVVVFENVIYG